MNKTVMNVLNSAILAGVVCGAIVVPAAAQDSKVASDIAAKKVTLNLENADLRYGLKLLFQAVGVNYTLDAAVQGTVTVSLTDVSFRTALESLLRSAQSQAPITYRVENGVYNVGLKREEQQTTVDPPAIEPPARKELKVARINLNYADPGDITAALGGTMLPSRLSQFTSGGMGGFGGFGNGGMNGGMGGGIGNGLGGGSGIGIINLGSGGFGQFGNLGGQPGGGGTGLIGNFGSGFGSGSGSGNGSGRRP